MLRLACVAALALAGPHAAEARRVIMRPSVPQSCPGTAKWETTEACVARFGKVKHVRDTADYKLLQLTQGEGNWGTSGFYLYVKNKQGWRIGGMYQSGDATLLAVSTPVYDNHKVYRLDLAHAGPDDLVFDGVSARRAFVRRKYAVFCPGAYASCTPVLTSCDVFFSGRLYATFRATLKYDKDGTMKVLGDRSRAGTECAQDEDAGIPVVTDRDELE